MPRSIAPAFATFRRAALRVTLVVLALGPAGGAPAQAFCLCLKCATGSFRHYTQNAQAMLPGLPEGSCFAMRQGTPEAGVLQRGQIISFTHAVIDDQLVFRLIGLPGDRVAIRAGQVWLNGAALARAPAPAISLPPGDGWLCAPDAAGLCPVPVESEALPDGPAWQIIPPAPGGMGAEMAEVTVPEDHVFVLGDYRDKAMDSRYGHDIGGPGMVPISTITGVFDSLLRP